MGRCPRRETAGAGGLNPPRIVETRGIVGLMVETLTAVAAVIGAVAGVIAAVGVLIVNGKLDRLTGRVAANTDAITAHVNAPGLHR